MTENTTYLPTFVLQGFFVPTIFFAIIGIIGEMGDQLNDTDDPPTRMMKRTAHRAKRALRKPR